MPYAGGWSCHDKVSQGVGCMIFSGGIKIFWVRVVVNERRQRSEQIDATWINGHPWPPIRC